MLLPLIYLLIERLFLSQQQEQQAGSSFNLSAMKLMIIAV